MESVVEPVGFLRDELVDPPLEHAERWDYVPFDPGPQDDDDDIGF